MIIIRSTLISKHFTDAAKGYTSITCVGDRKDILMGDHAGLMALDAIANHTVSHFSLYCVPMYRYPTKKEFCGAFPTSDPCVVYDGCGGCTEHGGVWCPDQKTCTK